MEEEEGEERESPATNRRALKTGPGEHAWGLTLALRKKKERKKEREKERKKEQGESKGGNIRESESRRERVGRAREGKQLAPSKTDFVRHGAAPGLGPPRTGGR